MRSRLQDARPADGQAVRLAPVVPAAVATGVRSSVFRRLRAARPVRGLQVELPASGGELGERLRERPVRDDVVESSVGRSLSRQPCRSSLAAGRPPSSSRPIRGCDSRALKTSCRGAAARMGHLVDQRLAICSSVWPMKPSGLSAISCFPNSPTRLEKRSGEKYPAELALR